jgi:hypothetical protein
MNYLLLSLVLFIASCDCYALETDSVITNTSIVKNYSTNRIFSNWIDSNIIVFTNDHKNIKGKLIEINNNCIIIKQNTKIIEVKTTNIYNIQQDKGSFFSTLKLVIPVLYAGAIGIAIYLSLGSLSAS